MIFESPPSIDIIKLLLKEGANIRCFDPLAMDNTKKILPDLTYCQDEYETAQGSNALVIATEWNQFHNLDLLKIKKYKKHITNTINKIPKSYKKGRIFS